MNTLPTAQAPHMVDEDDYRWLQRHCARLAHDDEVGEDLAQETLLEAWRNRHKLVDPQGRRAWLASIAEYVARRWRRGVQQEIQQRAPFDGGEHAGNDDAFVYGLAPDELALLLDHALALLPKDLRHALIAHYIEELPQREIAAQLGISQGTLAVRLHRGRLHLRKLFATTLHDEAATLGWDVPPTPGWQDTCLWCRYCSQHHLRARFNRERQRLLLPCPTCGPYIAHQTPLRAALDRILTWIDADYSAAFVTGEMPCIACGRTARLQQGLPAAVKSAGAAFPSVHLVCSCQAINTCDVPLLALASPTGRAFQLAHTRIRLDAQMEQDVGGVAALAITFVSITDNARLPLAVARDTDHVLAIHTS